MVVCGPWPGSTTTESGSGSTFVRRLLSMSGWFPPGKSVLPMDPANSTSPEKTSESMSGSGSYAVRNITEPGVCPGACSAPKLSPATDTSEPSAQFAYLVGLGEGGRAAGQLLQQLPGVGAHRPQRIGEQHPVVADGSSRSLASDRHSGVTENMWSRWPWVSSTATGLSRCSATSSVTPSTASMPGSMITHSAPGPVATR